MVQKDKESYQVAQNSEIPALKSSPVHLFIFSFTLYLKVNSKQIQYCVSKQNS